MTEPHLLLRQLMVSGGVALQAVTWEDVVGSMHRVIKTRNSESEDLLRALLNYHGPIPLAAGMLPHSQSPLDTLHVMALQTLANWDKQKHADIFREVARTANPSSILARIARSNL
jgi:hypothetical protein